VALVLVDVVVVVDEVGMDSYCCNGCRCVGNVIFCSSLEFMFSFFHKVF